VAPRGPVPAAARIFENRPIKWLLEQGTIVICAGGGGIPTMYAPGGKRILIGVEAVIDRISAPSCSPASSRPISS
jgi:carbamate kinase